MSLLWAFIVPILTVSQLPASMPNPYLYLFYLLARAMRPYDSIQTSEVLWKRWLQSTLTFPCTLKTSSSSALLELMWSGDAFHGQSLSVGFQERRTDHARLGPTLGAGLAASVFSERYPVLGHSGPSWVTPELGVCGQKGLDLYSWWLAL